MANKTVLVIGADGKPIPLPSGDTATDANGTAVGSAGSVDTANSPQAGEWAKFTDTDTIEGRTASELKADLDLEIGTDIQAYDAELAALAGLTSAANKIPMFSGAGTATLIDLKDEDNMASDSATAVPTQQSVKAYVDTQISSTLTSEMSYKGGYNASTNSPDLDTTPTGVKKGDTYTVTDAGTFFTQALEVGDVIIATIDDADVLAEWTIVQNNLTFGIANGNSLRVDSADAADDEYARFTASGIESRSVAEVKGDLSVDDLVTLSGVADGAVNLGTFTGSTIADNQTIKAAIQALETSLETKRKTDTFTQTFYTDGQNQLTGALVMDITVPYACYLVAASVKASSARTAGTLSLEPHKNGTGLTPTDLDLQLDDNPTTKHNATVAYGTTNYDYAAGDTIGMLATTTSWTPLANSFTISLTVERA